MEFRKSHGTLSTALLRSIIPLIFIVGSASAADEEKPFPTLATVESTARRHFDSLKDYQSGDIISRRDVEPVFKEINKLGWRVAEKEEILAKIPADDDFLVRQLRTKAGRKFMSKATGGVQTYNRLDTFSKYKGGNQFVRDVVQMPDGYKYTTPGHTPTLRQLGDFLPKDVNIDRPTGKLYTVKMFLVQLRKSYAKVGR